MKFSAQWLRRWVDPALSIEELAHQLTMAGLEVDAIEAVAPPFSHVVVAEVKAVEPHPDADKLRVCQVDVGGDSLLTIVCGAPNVAVGMKVPAALIGAVLPGEIKIKKSKLRGVVSMGMLCSASELGLSDERGGLMPLAAELAVGQEVRQALELEDMTLELGLTPNRGDCLSLLGIAREVGVLNDIALTPPPLTPVEVELDERFAVDIRAPAACPVYACRIVRGLDRTVSTPLWMVERLRRSGMRSLGPLVDVTNYVMLELGQPMHAFNLAALQGSIVVRLADEGETLSLLNETTVELHHDTLVIADSERALALAGIMGGSESAVEAQTGDILLESAFFTPEIIAGRARRYGLHTDSSHRFERGVDPTLQRRALERATALLLDICGGQAGPIEQVILEEHLPKSPEVVLRLSRLEAILGVSLPAAQVETILRRLELQPRLEGESLRVRVPPFRFDITQEIDLIEEVGRIIGYDRLPTATLPLPKELPVLSELRLEKERFCDLLVDRGYFEAVSYSFVAPQLEQLLNGGQRVMTLQNPISAEMSVMRTSLWSGLLGALQYNLNRQQERVRLFETGLRFLHHSDGELQQQQMLAGVVTGSVVPEQWGESSRRVDFFDLKGDVEQLLALTGRREAFLFSPQPHPALHPGQSAAILSRQGEGVGYLGMLHPAVSQTLGLPKQIYLFELQLQPLLQGELPRFSELSRFPAVKRDLAFIVADDVLATELLEAVNQVAVAEVSGVTLFDLYQGENVGEGRKSLAIRLTLQAESKTLTDDEVEAVVERIVAHLRRVLGATIRD
ncbi:phenylalanine--tRNA ligase subunit beta [Ectothiorhodospiraceae bacterium BW-2]|nr:phenylalanine--tRNA ligase subunit beta [Ectothiorhodospiraceae bacterium BW-2]